MDITFKLYLLINGGCSLTGLTSQPSNIIGPDSNSENAILDVEVEGTVTAHFTYIEHLELEVEVQPAGAGAVTVVNTICVEDYWTEEFNYRRTCI